MPEKIEIHINHLVNELHVQSTDEATIKDIISNSLLAAVRDSELVFKNEEKQMEFQLSVKDNTDEFKRLFENYIKAKKELENFKLKTDIIKL